MAKSRILCEVTIRMIVNPLSEAEIESVIRRAVEKIKAAEAGELDVMAKTFGPITVNEHGFAVPLPPLNKETK